MLTATLRSDTDLGDPGCEDNDPVNATTTVNIDFEIDGTNDPENPNSLSTTSPDRSCDIVSGQSNCTVQYTGTLVGSDTIYAWVDEDGSNATPEVDQAEPASPDDNDDTDRVTKSWTAGRLDCEPETDSNPAGSSHTVTCTARDAEGNPVNNVNIDAEATGDNDPDDNSDQADPDFTCTTSSNGQCSFIHGPAATDVPDKDTSSPGTTTYTAWVDADNNDATSEADPDEGPNPNEGVDPGSSDPEPDDTDVVTKNWTASGLDCIPEEDANTVGSSHTVTCHATQNGQPTSGVEIDAEATGANDPDGNGDPTTPDFTCTTGPNGQCSFTHGPGGKGTTNEGGTTEYRAFVDANGSDPDPNDNANNATEADMDEGRDEVADPGDPAPEPDNTDVVEKDWTGRLDCKPEADSNPTGSNHTITCESTDVNSAPVAEEEIDVEATGANDPDNSNSPETPDFTCETPPDPPPPGETAGECSFTHGPGGTPPRSTDSAGTTTYRAWVDGDHNDATTEADMGETPAGEDADNTDVVQKTWTAGRLNCEPEEATNAPGQSHTVTCTATDNTGAAVQGMQVDAEATGQNDPDNADSPTSPDFTCTTGPNGQCSFTHSGNTSQQGDTLYRAWIDADNSDTTPEGDADEGRDEGADPGDPAPEPDDTDVVEKHWSPADTLDCDDASGDDVETNPHNAGAASNEVYTCRVRTATNQPISGRVVNGEVDAGFPTGTNDPPAGPADDGATYDSPDYTCTTNASGDCQITVTQADNEQGTAEICFYMDDGTACGTESTQEPESNDGADRVEKTWAVAGAPSGLDAQPETDVNRLGDNHVITATVYEATGSNFTGSVQVNFEFFQGSPSDTDGNTPASPDRTCTTSNSNSCSVTYSQATTAGTDLVCVWINNTPSMSGTNTNGTCNGEGRADASGDDGTPNPASDNVEVVEKTWAAGIDCTPETATNATNTAHTVTCTTRDANNNNINNVNIDVEATGTNDPDSGDSPTTPDFTCTTSNGQCTFTHGPSGTSNAGTTTYRAWVDHDNNNATTEADATEGQNEATTPGTRAENDNTDVVTKTWGAPVPGLDCSPETAANPTNSGHTVTCTARDASNNPVNGANIDVEATGANDPDSGDSPTSPDFTCTTGASGQCSFTHGVGGTGATNNAGTTTYRAWVDADNNNGTAEADVNEGRDEAATPGAVESDNTDVVQKTWSAARLDCSPETDSNPTGTAHIVTCTARDTNGAAVQGVQVDVELSGDNDLDGSNSAATPDLTCSTAADGNCSVTHTGANAGTTTYRGWIDLDGNNATTEADSGEGRDEGATPGAKGEIDETDVVEKTWTTAPITPSPSVTTTATTPGPAARLLLLEASRRAVTVDRSFSLTASLRGTTTATPPACIAGVEVTLSRTVLGTTQAVAVATAVTDGAGVVTFDRTADRSANYIASVPSSAACGAATSEAEAVLVRKRVALRFSPNRLIRAGTRVTAIVSFAPCAGHEGDRVTLWKNIGGVMSKIAEKRSSSSCIARFTRRINKDSVFQGRAPKTDDDHLGGKSGRRGVNVR